MTLLQDLRRDTPHGMPHPIGQDAVQGDGGIAQMNPPSRFGVDGDSFQVIWEDGVRCWV
jgi:hypothetical protein